MADVLIGAVVSVLTGVGLWAVLPRGVVLTRSISQREPGTWELRNDSALPVRLTSVTVESVHTYNEETGKIDVLDLPPEYLPGDRFLGATLAFDDPATENLRTAHTPPWRGQVVRPGDTLRAVVHPNARIRIKYRRAGWLGVFERRETRIDGGP
jgi:hypothetical protein